MEERRKAKRLKEEDEIVIEVLFGGETLPKGEIFYALSKDISVSGAIIQTNSILPVDTLLNIKLRLKNPLQIITTVGKVKWVRMRSVDEFYEAGVEFFNMPHDETKKLVNYISSKQ
jgi:c-di-GMP-binding flagellar brake protein YcgR